MKAARGPTVCLFSIYKDHLVHRLVHDLEKIRLLGVNFHWKSKLV